MDTRSLQPGRWKLGVERLRQFRHIRRRHRPDRSDLRALRLSRPTTTPTRQRLRSRFRCSCWVQGWSGSEYGAGAASEHRGRERPAGYASSTSIFFAAASSLTMRKLRICPARAALRARLPPAACAALPLGRQHRGQRRKIRLGSAGCLFLRRGIAAGDRGRSPGRLRPVPPAPGRRETSATRPVTTSPSLCSAMYSSRLVGTSCFMPSRMRRFSRIDFEHLRLHHLAHLQHVLRMIDALLGADVADVDHALDAFGKLHERAELRAGW